MHRREEGTKSPAKLHGADGEADRLPTEGLFRLIESSLISRITRDARERPVTTQKRSERSRNENRQRATRHVHEFSPKTLSRGYSGPSIASTTDIGKLIEKCSGKRRVSAAEASLDVPRSSWSYYFWQYIESVRHAWRNLRITISVPRS